MSKNIYNVETMFPSRSKPLHRTNLSECQTYYFPKDCVLVTQEVLKISQYLFRFYFLITLFKALYVSITAIWGSQCSSISKFLNFIHFHTAVALRVSRVRVPTQGPFPIPPPSLCFLSDLSCHNEGKNAKNKSKKKKRMHLLSFC